MALLELRDISSAYGNVQALKGVSLQVEAGELVTLLGANGAGKSSTLKTISGLLAPTTGEVLFDGKPIHRAGPEAIARLGISHVPEGRRIFPGLTVRENILLGASNRKGVARRQLETEADEKGGVWVQDIEFADRMAFFNYCSARQKGASATVAPFPDGGPLSPVGAGPAHQAVSGTGQPEHGAPSEPPVAAGGAG